VIGGSAGGHLSLVLATQGGKGDEKDKDEVNRDSSAVQAVACWFPPTDFLNYGEKGHVVLGNDVLEFIMPAFPKAETEQEKQKLGHDISPIYFVRSNQPPTLIIHGDADKLVPLQQSESFVEKSKQAGATAKLIMRPGKGHGWPDFMQDLKLFGDWMDEHLLGKSESKSKRSALPRGRRKRPLDFLQFFWQKNTYAVGGSYL
jgi:acetyl esterase/lipase